METSLDSILNGTSEAPEAPPAEAPAPAEVEAAPERPRDEQGRFLPKGENEPEPAEAAPEPSATPAPSDHVQTTIPLAAQMDERRKRQATEAENAELRRQLAQIQQPPPQQLQPQPVPDQWDDPDGWAMHVKREAAEAARHEAVMAFQAERVKASAEDAMVKYPDYHEKREIFTQLAQNNPALWDTLFQQRDPAGWAYSIAKDHAEMSQFGSLEARDAAKKAEWEAEALERLKATLPASPAPPTLSTERNVGQRSGPAWSGPTPLVDLLN